MAESLLSPLLEVIFDKLVSLITEEDRLQRGVYREMERLRTTLTTIQAVLEDAEEQQVKDKAVKIWLGELKDAAYDADDVLDEFMTEALRKKIESEDHHHMMNKASFNMLLRKIIYAERIDRICLDWCILVGLIATCYRGTSLPSDTIDFTFDFGLMGWSSSSGHFFFPMAQRAVLG